MAQVRDINYWTRRKEILEDAYTSRSLKVTFEGRLEEFRSMDDLLRAIGYCVQKIYDLGGTVPGYTAGPVRSTRVDMNDYF